MAQTEGHGEAIARMDERIAHIHNRLDSELPKIAEALERLTRFDGKVEGMIERFDRIEERMTLYERERDEEMATVSKIQTDVADLQAEGKAQTKIKTIVIGFACTVGGALATALIIKLFEVLT